MSASQSVRPSFPDLDGDAAGRRDVFHNSLRRGAVASLTTTIAAAACGAHEVGSALAPLNAVSHILWGDEAAEHDDVSLRYTAAGLALNAAAVLSWAAVYEMLFRTGSKKEDAATALLRGAAVAGLAYVTDYYVVPRRFTPGFEKRLSNGSLACIYAALAVGLGLGGMPPSAGNG